MGPTSNPRRVLGAVSVAAITFFNVCGGPWGSEEIVSDAGPLPGLIGVVVFATVWGMPLASITAELSSAFPDDGGYSLWVGEAFGEFWAFQESYMSWISGVIDNALYPGLVYAAAANVASYVYADHHPGSGDAVSEYMNEHPAVKYGIKLGLATLFMVPNIFCIRHVGVGMAYLGAFVMVPFVILCALAIPHLDPDRLVLPPWIGNSGGGGNSSSTVAQTLIPAPAPSSSPGSTPEYGYPTSWDQGWGDLFSVLYWNLSGFDCVSTCAGEVRDPGKSFPRGLALALLLIVVSYMAPLAFSTMATDPEALSNWGNDDGECSWSCIARSIGGEWLMYLTLIASFAGNMGMYIAEMFEDSWQLLGMAENGMVPRIFARRHPRFQTPVHALLLSWVLIAGMCYFDFMDNLAINNFFSCGSCILEICAFLKLRFYDPELRRPFRVPVGRTGAVLLCLPPLLLGAVVLFSCCAQSWSAAGMNAAAVLVGCLVYVLMSRYGAMRYGYNPKRRRMMSESSQSSDGNAVYAHQLSP